jgi:hypothetical protein
MNYFYLRLFAVSAAAAVALSCQEQNGPADAVALATPEVSAAVSGDNVTVSWTQIPNAATYSWNIDSNAARTTDQTSVTVSTSDLAEGEHTVYVIANPALDAADQYTASQPGSYTFTVTARVESQRLETPIVTAESDGKGGVVVSWSSIEHAASYTYSLDSGEWKSTTDTTVTYQTFNLTATTHTVSVIAQPEEGSSEYRESLPGDCSFTVQHEIVDPIEELRPWLGTYTLEFTSTVVVDVNSNNQAEFVFEKGKAGIMENRITIQPSTNENYVWISGLSPLSEYSLWATIMESEDGKRCLGIVTGDMAVAQDANGNDMLCAPICWNEEDGAVAIFSGTEYAYLIDPETKTSIPRELVSSSDVQYSVVAADIFSFDGNGGVGIYYGNYPTYIPAGTLTFTQTSTSYAAQDSKVMTVVKAAPTSMSSAVTK